MFLWSLSQEFLNHPCPSPLSWTYLRRESWVVWAEPRGISPTGVVLERGVAGSLGLPEPGNLWFLLCMEVIVHKKLVTPTYVYCLIKEQCPKEPVLLWLQFLRPLLFYRPRSLSVLPEHYDSVPTVLPLCPELTVYLRSREIGAILDLQLQSTL